MYSVIQHKLAQHLCHPYDYILCTYSKYVTIVLDWGVFGVCMCNKNVYGTFEYVRASIELGPKNAAKEARGGTRRRGNEAAAMTKPPRPRDSLVFLGLGPRLLWGLWFTSPLVFAHREDDIAHQDEVGRNDRRNRRIRGVLCARRRLSGHGIRGDGTHRPRSSAARGSRRRWE